MYHNQLTADLPLNPAMSSKLLKVARKAMIHHVGSRDSAPEVVLTDSWSTTTSIIYKDFCSKILNLPRLQLKYGGNWLQLQPLLPAGSSSSTNQHPEYCAQLLVQEPHRRETSYQDMKQEQRSKLLAARREVEVMELWRILHE